MRFFGFYALSAAWLFALLAPLVAFYFLKLKRPRLRVPSLVLWRQVMSDQRVNSPFQRFKRNILLILQALLLICLALAAMQPYWRGRSSRIDRLPILIDCSASMAALDKPGGQTRLDVARAAARKFIDGMLPDQEICLISFSNTAQKRTDFTTDRRLLRDALNAIRVEDVPSDIEDALRMTQALGRSAYFDEVLLLSDGNFPTKAHVELSFKLTYQQLPAPGPNRGITALNARRNAAGNWEVFASIEASATAEGPVTVTLERDGEPLDRQTLSPAFEKAERVLFSVPGDRPSELRLRLWPEDFDSLTSDNEATLSLPAVRPLWVYCSPGLAAFRHALQTLPYVRVFPEPGGTQTDFDLIITDQADTQGFQANTRLTVGTVPSDAQRLLTVGQEGTRVVDWQRTHPLLQHVELGEVLFVDRPVSNEGVRENDYDEIGYDILVHGQTGPLALEKRTAGTVQYHLLFHTDRSTLPYRVGFPILVTNLAESALRRAGLSEITANRTGVLPERKYSPEETLSVTGPGGYERTARADAQGNVAGISAPYAGTYTVGGRAFGVSLQSGQETGLAPRDRIEFNEELNVQASTGPARSDRALWKWLAWAGLGIVMVEWWYFQRRIGT